MAMLFAVVQGVPPLTPDQQAQVDTATDFVREFDEGALYPLLEDALRWPEGDEAGAMIPDYEAIMKSPGDYRGGLFLIEGLFAGTPRGGSEVRRLTRPGPWDDQLVWWGIVVDAQRDEVVVVYLVDPPPPPAAGAKVRLVGRFFKVLEDFDRSRPPKPTNYLLFVGRSASVLGGQEIGGRSTPGITPLLGMVVVLGLGWYVVRRMLRPKPGANQARRALRGEDHDEADLDDPVIDDLPKDPAEALDALSQQHAHEEGQEDRPG